MLDTKKQLVDSEKEGLQDASHRRAPRRGGDGGSSSASDGDVKSKRDGFPRTFPRGSVPGRFLVRMIVAHPVQRRLLGGRAGLKALPPVQPSLDIAVDTFWNP